MSVICMRNIFLGFLKIIFLCDWFCIIAFHIHVDIDMLVERKSHELLPILVDVSDLNIAAFELETAHISILIDAHSCHKFDESFYDVAFFFPKSCVRKESFWFSILISIGDDHMSSLPLFVPLDPQYDVASKITFVLPLTLNDLPRSRLLIESFQQINTDIVEELKIYVPHDDLQSIQSLLHDQLKGLRFPALIYSEKILLHDVNARLVVYPYAKQMAIKILAASFITTEFYLTLDADLILLREIWYDDFFDEAGRAKYDHESRQVHPSWWRGSYEFLGKEPDSYSENDKNGFGVTPAVLSTYGSLLVIDYILTMYENTHGAIGYWVGSLGRNGIIWSEYTLYRIVLDHYHMFNYLHYQSNKNYLHCFDVWYDFDFPWDSIGAMRSGCLFSVIQSSTGVDVTTLQSQFRAASAVNFERHSPLIIQ